MAGSVWLEATVFIVEDYYCLLWPAVHNNLKVIKKEESGHAMSTASMFDPDAAAVAAEAALH